MPSPESSRPVEQPAEDAPPSASLLGVGMLARLADAALAVLAAPSPELLLARAANEARALVGARRAGARLARNRLGAAGDAGGSLDEDAGWRVDSEMEGSGIADLAWETGRPIRLTRAEVARHPRWRRVAVADAPPVAPAPSGGLLAAPLPARDGGCIGLLHLSGKVDGGEFGAEDEAAVVQLARVVGLALENADLAAEARASERRYRTLIEHAPAVVYEWAAGASDGAPRYVSPRLNELLGVAPEDAVRRFAQWRTLVHPDDLPGVDAEDRRSDLAGDRFRADYRLRRADGRWIWVRDIASPVRDDGGRIAGWQGVLIDISEEMRATASARTGEERLGLALDAARMASWDRDAVTGDVYRSPGWSDLFGLPGESPTADRAVFLARVHPDDRPRLAEAERRRTAGGPYAVEYRVVHPDGAVRWLRDRGQAILGPDGRPRRFLGVTQDVTEQREAEAHLVAAKEAAEATERLMRQTLEALSDGFLSLDRYGRIRYLNPAAARILHRAVDDLIGRNVWEEFAPARDTPFHGAFRAAVDEGRAATVVEPYPPLGGWFEARMFPAPGGASVFVRDVTEARQAEAALREQADRLAAIVAVQEEVAADGGDPTAVMRLVVRHARRLADADGAGIALVEDDRVVYRAGSGFPADLVGVAYPIAGSLAGECLRRNAVVRADDALADPRSSRAAAREFGLRSVLLAPLRHDGRAIGVLSLLSPRPGAFGDRDASLLRLLAGFVGASLAHAEAFAAEQQASRLKSAFLSTMSHELRTPLNAIGGYAHLLLDGMAGPLSPAQEGDVRQIAAGADRLLALVDDVLDLSRIEAGAFDLAPEPVEAAALLRDLRADVAPQAAAKGLTLRFDAEAGLVIDADRQRLRQVLLNLVGNAVKFTESGLVAVRARAVAGGVEIAVTDTGIGIDAAVLPHVFDEFRQADGSTSRRYGGTGLGLAIAKRLTELHGGSLRADSTPGVGSTFTVWLPAGSGDG